MEFSIEVKPDVRNISSIPLQSISDSKDLNKSEMDAYNAIPFNQVHSKDLYTSIETVAHRRKLKNGQTFSCDLCNKRYISTKCFETHLMQHLSETPLISLARIESILDCKSKRKDERGKRKIGCKKIKAIKIKPPCICDVCGKSFKFKSCLRIHYTKHTKLKKYHCYDCGKAFVSKGYLKKHHVLHSIYSNSLKSGLPVVCNLCNKHFLKMDNIKHHMYYHLRGKLHSKISQEKSLQKSRRKKPCICDICGKVCSCKSLLKQHYVVHTKMKLYLCDVCGRSYASKEYLNRHYKQHTSKKEHACEDCGLSFHSKIILNKHRLSHVKVKAHKCNECGKSFTVKNYLQRHYHRVHSKDGLFPCEHCNKSFSLKSFLTRHLPVHTKAKPFFCTICGILFKRKSSLGDHLLRHKRRNQMPID
ncbi:zinc finger protein 12-like [Physella acuta]|uniref:zinc finger protein 12-like n=1 Tax=Physella acuta TaxID=109671 RepID=UPI0027DE4E43|nr:zinc finger protein 12-like [Physella acuta]XP_059170826.1 zinc finger protein 12-like [Physella acuta]XP_059170827.1 zinc finger protein 12-like [Physella acuta]XP_059170828.1 zinc finger protein 12-like [Physella acuta]XP_059170829.1 zinc finger protein 12-like [Physella acuta]